MQLIPRDLVPRDGNCVKCDDTKELQCPNCSDDQECQFTVPLDCTQCAKSVCVDSGNSSSDGDGGGGGPNVGAIVGGVLGGIIAIAAVTYLVWRYCIKPKRSQMSQSVYEGDRGQVHDSEKDAASRRTHRSSTHTVHSIASTVLTRASNIIQIAYIPGVTNRATPTSPGVLVPPVPPIPMQHANGNRGSGYEDQHFFVPGDLRDSTYSALSGYTDRTSFARTSYAPRSSIASTIYGKQAQVLTPAQTGMRAKPTVVSVKSVGNGSGGSTPPVPSIDFEKFGNGRPKSGASAFSVGSTFLNNANTATQARAQVVKVGGLKKIEIGSNKSEGNSPSPSMLSVSSITTPDKTQRDSNAVTVIEDSPSPSTDQGPFSDPPSMPSPLKSAGTPSLGAVIEDQAAEDEREPGRQSVSVRRDSSPFGDEHATKD